MSPKIQTPFGHAPPPAPRHAIATHMPTWQTVLDFIDRKPELMQGFVNFYPRVMLQRDVKELNLLLLQYTGKSGQMSCLIFPSAKVATQCIVFATSSERGDVQLPPDDVSIKIFDAGVRIYAVFFPEQSLPVMKTIMSFWINAGVGISTRVAERCLLHADALKEVPSHETLSPIPSDSPAYGRLRERIAGLLERAPVGPSRRAKVKSEDVYLYQTGMAAIWHLHQYLLASRNSTTVLVGFSFHATFHVLEDWGPGFKFFGHGTDDELGQVEAFMQVEADKGRPVQAVWTEFPNNPMLVSADLDRLRVLADRYGFVLIVDDTIGGFCNIDVLGVAHVVITSLTKSFNGYADAMAASAVLSPSSNAYPELKNLFKRHYRNDLFAGDAEILEINSRDYFPRSAVLNRNTGILVDYLQSLVSDASSSVVAVYHPSTSWSSARYKSRLRPATDDFTPGYGCLFSVEFDTVAATAVFYDSLNVHKSPHLGAHVTFALPYVSLLYADQLDYVGQWGLKETQIRIAPGLENPETLLEDFKIAISAVEAWKVHL